MFRNKKSRLNAVGASPGTLSYPEGTLTQEADVQIYLFDYDAEKFYEQKVDNVSQCFPYRDKPSVTWIDIEGQRNIEILQKIGEHFGVHPLVLEDILSVDQRPKFEDHGSYLFIVLRMLKIQRHQTGQEIELDIEQVSLIVGENFVISFQQGKDGDVFNPIRERIRSGKGRIRKQRPDYLAYALMDCVVDNYFVVLDKLEERLSHVDTQLLSETEIDILKVVHILKKYILLVRKAVWPLREAVTAMQKSESALLTESTEIFLRDLHDHLNEASDTIESFRDISEGLVDIYLSNASHRTNQVIQFLTIMASIFIPLTFIVGIYGMNFQHMPELESPYGYPSVLTFMVLVAVSLLAFFKRKRWL